MLNNHEGSNELNPLEHELTKRFPMLDDKKEHAIIERVDAYIRVALSWKRSLLAAQMIISGKNSIVENYTKQLKELSEAKSILQSERDANHQLTCENERLITLTVELERQLTIKSKELKPK